MFTSCIQAACHVSTVLVASTVLYLLRCGLRPGVQSPGKNKHPQTLFVSYLPVQHDFTEVQACPQFVKKVLFLCLLGCGLRSSVQSPRVTRTNKTLLCNNYQVSQEDTSASQESSSSEQETEMHSPSFQPSTSQAQFVPAMFMPYIEGPKMDLTVNDSLYQRFLKWRLKCENILDCELAMLPESKKCKKVISWAGDFGMDQYVSLCLPAEELNLGTIWAKYEYFSKPQANEARFDLLTSFRQGSRSVDEWYNTVHSTSVSCRIPTRNCKHLAL